MQRGLLLAVLFLPGRGQPATAPSFELQNAANGMATIIVRNPSNRPSKWLFHPTPSSLIPNFRTRCYWTSPARLRLDPRRSPNFVRPPCAWGNDRNQPRGRLPTCDRASSAGHPGGENARNLWSLAKRRRPPPSALLNLFGRLLSARRLDLLFQILLQALLVPGGIGLTPQTALNHRVPILFRGLSPGL